MINVWQWLVTLVEPWFAYFGRRWRYRRGVRFFFMWRKSRARFYRGRRDAWTIINDYDGDLKLRIDRSTYLGSLIYWHGGQFTHDFDLLRLFLKPDMVMIDVGANQGETTLLAAKHLPHGQVIAFEPIPELYTQLHTNIALNNLHNISAFCCALASQPGTMPIYTSMDMEIHSSWNEGLASLYHSNYRDTPLHQVSVDRLDTFERRLSLARVDLIKIDVEGGETDVLRGAIETLIKYRPYLIVEINTKALTAAGSSKMQLIDLITSFNYQVSRIVPGGNYQPVTSVDELVDCDIFCEPLNSS